MCGAVPGPEQWGLSFHGSRSTVLYLQNQKGSFWQLLSVLLWLLFIFKDQYSTENFISAAEFCPPWVRILPAVSFFIFFSEVLALFL